MFAFKKLTFFIMLFFINTQIHSQVFPDSIEYKNATAFLKKNPKKLNYLVDSIDKDTYGKCLMIVTQWDIGLRNNVAETTADVKALLAVQWVGLAEARKKLMSQGVSSKELSESFKSYNSRNDIGNGNTNWLNWGKECVIMANNAINY